MLRRTTACRPLQAENVKNREMKDKVRNEYMRRVKLLVKSELYVGNLVKGINTWAMVW